FPLSMLGVAINDAIPLATVNALADLFPTGLRGQRVLVLGASYRQDVGDTRFSPSAILITALLKCGAVVEVADPLAESFPEVSVPLHRELPPPSGYDAIVLAVGHKEYRELDLIAWMGAYRPIVFDSNGVLPSHALRTLQESGF